MFYKNYIKRILDIVISLGALTLLLPLFFIVSIIIKLDSEGSLIFKQLRVGKYKKEFYIYKFRTMSLDAPKEQPTSLLLNADQYITRTGRFLRKTSLDELPQLINILKGDMSIIGPRPVIRTEIELIKQRDKNDIYNIRPGLSGWAQINGRDEVTNKEKVHYDKYYFDNISLILDIKIFILTVIKVLKSEGVNEGPSKELARKSK